MKNTKGITLITLIITIIIMLILVRVGINLSIKGDLFGSAENAVNGTNAKVEQEQSRVDELMQILNTELGRGSVKYNTSKMVDLQGGIMLCKTAKGTNGAEDIYSELQRVNELTSSVTNGINTEEDIKNVLGEIQERLEKIDELSNNNQYKGEYLLKGKLSRSVGANGMHLNIDDLSTIALGINNVDISSPEKAGEYLKKTQNAIKIVVDNMSRISNVQEVLEKLLIMYDEQNQIINSGVSDADIEITVHALSTMEEIINTCIQCANISYGESANDKETLKKEMQYWLKGIDVIYDNAEYDGKKLLDGTFKGVAKINTTTLDIGTDLNINLANDASIDSLISKLQLAIQKIKGEISKLGKTSVAKDIGKDKEITAMQDAIALCKVAKSDIDELLGMLNWINSGLASDTLEQESINEIKQILEELDRYSTFLQYNGEILFDGTFARNVGKKGVYLKLINCSSKSLGLASSTLDEDLSTTAGKEAYITKVENAITKVTKQKNDIEKVQEQLQKLIDET